jgi:hypothetical protein
MIVAFENEIQQGTTLLCDPLAPALQILFKPLLRRERHVDFAEGEIVRHAERLQGAELTDRSAKKLLIETSD